MNITDLIVDFIKEGNVVEFPGMGTLTSSTVSAHHDAATGTYYPARRTVVLNGTLNGNQSVIRKIAENECVTVEIAEMMWKNYVDALNDKLQRDPNGHDFNGIGNLRRVGNKVVFTAKEGLDLDADKRLEQPLENVATYTPKQVEDPFAAFEKKTTPAPEPKPAPAPKPVEPAPAPKPVEPAPAPKPVEPVPAPKPVEPAPAPKPVEPAPAPKPVEPAPAPKPAVAPEPKPAVDDTNTFKPFIESVAATTAATAAASASAEHLSEVKKMLDEIPASNKSEKETRRAEKAAAKAEKEARKAAEKAEKEAAKKAARLAKEKESAAKEAEKALRHREKSAAKAEKAPAITSMPTPPAASEDRHEKKKHGWLWIILLLLLALIACTVYYFFLKGKTVSGESYAKEVSWSRYDAADRMPMGAIDFDMLNLQEFDEGRIASTVNDVHVYMSEYIHNFLLARHYSNAFVPMMNSIDQYAGERLHELMVPGMSSKRFHPYTDFWMDRHVGSYQNWGGRYYQFKVQEELMDVELLENVLDELVVRLGLHADGFGLTGNGAAAKTDQHKSLVDRPFEETVPDAPTFRNSKQGYDIIAGFATDKRKANKLANQLKKLGSDAYIISKSGGYYISMGSAPTLTAAQAMENHIKTWYQGPVSIKNFND